MSRSWADIFRYTPEEDEDLDALYAEPPEFGGNTYRTDAPSARKAITEDDILRWSSWTRAFPLPSHLSPTGGRLFENVPDQVLLDAPPHMIVHLQRTAAQGGLQVISPRQTPFSCLMNRTVDTRRDLGDHVVGSIAAADDEWPTIDGASFEDLLPDEPLPPLKEDLNVRSRTRTEPLTRATKLMQDPILACLVKGRAVIDVQQRDDVMGDSGGLTEILADAWSIEPQQLMDLDAFTLGIDGPLLRHAIKSDDVYPIVHAPTHRLRSVSVGSNDISRDLLPADSAMDWRRLRVFCEAVFLLSISIEGIPMKLVRARPPPGDPTAPLTRDNILAFRPAPCVAWTFEGRSFSVIPEYTKGSKQFRSIPPEVLSALARYTSVVRPMSHIMSKGFVAPAKQARAVSVAVPDSETLRESYVVISKHLSEAGARGKTPFRAVRNYIFEALDNAPSKERLRIVRYLTIAKEEVRIHLGLNDVPDRLIHRIATNFLRIGETIRLRVAQEAARRGETIEDWWRQILSQVPERYACLAEGSMGWAKVAMWLVFKSPTPKWDGLVRTAHYQAIRESSISNVGGVALPAELGSIDRVLQASRTFVDTMTAAYFSYYIAVADVGYGIADILEERGEPRSSDILREACYLWYLRARALRGTNVNAWDKGKPTPSMNHLRICGPGMDLLVVPTPYRAFTAYKAHLLNSTVIHKGPKNDLLRFEGNKISKAFTALRVALAPCKQTVITRYLVEPWKLGEDMEKAWTMLAEDVARVVTTYAIEAAQPPDKKQKLAPLISSDPLLNVAEAIAKAKQTGNKYIDMLIKLPPDTMDWAEDLVASLGENESALFQERTFATAKDLYDALKALEESDNMAVGGELETVG